MKSFGKYWFPVILYAGLIYYFSSLSHPLGEISLAPGWDKLIHLFEYAFLGLLLRRALLKASIYSLRQQAIFWTLIFGIAYGASDEFHQYFVPGRQTSLWDLIFNGLGVVGSLGIRIE